MLSRSHFQTVSGSFTLTLYRKPINRTHQRHAFASGMIDMGKPTCHVAIVGGGLGGLAAAIAIRRQGHDVTILERTKELSEVESMDAEGRKSAQSNRVFAVSRSVPGSNSLRIRPVS